MKHGIAVMLALVGLAGCGTPTQGIVETGRVPEEVLATFRREVHRQLSTSDGSVREDDLEKLLLKASRIAQQRLLPERRLLMAKAQRELADLPDPDKRSPESQWVEAKTIEGSTISDSVRDFMEEWELEEAERPGRDAFLYAMSFWSPSAAALRVRDYVLLEFLSVDDYGQRSMMRALASPVFWAVDRDPKRPVIAVDMGPEVCIVHLERTSQGAYVDIRTQIFRQSWRDSVIDENSDKSE